MPLPDERPRPSVANLIGKFETSQKRNSTSSPAGVAGVHGSTTAAPLPRKPSIDATSPRAIAQQLTGNDSSANGTSASAWTCALSDQPTIPPTAQEVAGSGLPVSTPAPINGEDGAKYKDGTKLSLSDLKVPDVQEVPPTPLAERTDVPPTAEEPAPTASPEPAAPSKRASASLKKPATSFTKPTIARSRPSSATSSTPKPPAAAAAQPKPKPKLTTGSMGKPPTVGAPRAPRPSSTASNANTRLSSTVRTTVSTSKAPVIKSSTAPKPASTTPATSSSIARKPLTASRSTLTPGAAPAKKSSTSSLRPSAAAAAAPSAGDSASLRKSVSGKPATSATSTSTKPAPGTTSTFRKPATGTTPSTTATGGSGSRGGVKPRVGLVGAGRVKDPAAVGKATISTATQKAGAPGGKGKATAVVTKGTAAVAGVAPVAAEEAKPERVIKAEDEGEVPVQGGQVVVSEVSSEEPHEAPEEHYEAYVEVLASDVGSHEEGRSVPASPPIESEEQHYAEGSVREDEVTSPPPVCGSDHEHEHEHEQPGDEEHESLQLSEEQQAELLEDDVPALPEPSEQEVAEATANPGAEEHLEKVVPPHQPPVLPTGDEEKCVEVEGILEDV